MKERGHFSASWKESTRVQSLVAIEYKFNQKILLRLQIKEMATSMPSLYVTYKEDEEKFRRSLFGKAHEDQKVTAGSIKDATRREVTRQKKKFKHSDLEILERVIAGRRAVTTYYEGRGRECAGHAYWISLLECCYKQLAAGLSETPVNDTTEISFEKLIIEEPEEVKTYEATREEIWILKGLDDIKAMGQWLRKMWKEAVSSRHQACR